jgi:hypothetical protein
MGNVKLRSVFGILLLVAVASLTVLAGCAPLRLPPAAPVADGGASRGAGGVRPGDTNVTNLVAAGDVTVGGDLTVSGECAGCGSMIESLDDIPDLTASGPMTVTLVDDGQLVFNGGAFDEDVAVLRLKTSGNQETLLVTEDGEILLGESGKLIVGSPWDQKVIIDKYGVSVIGSVDVTGYLSGEKWVTPVGVSGNAHLGGAIYTNEGASGARTRTLPSAEPGMTESFYVEVAQPLYIDPAAGDQIHVLTDAVGDRISSSTPGDSICLVAVNHTDWAVCGMVGTWTDAN